MARKIRFLHTADLHLGAPVRGFGNLNARWAERIMAAIGLSYKKLISRAIKEQVDFVIIAGDIFDTTKPAYTDYLCFVDGLKRLQEADIPVYICLGNHDPYTSWKQDFGKLPDNTHLFEPLKPSFFTYIKDGEDLAVLGGCSYFNQTWPQEQDISAGLEREQAYIATASQAPFYVGVIHSGLTIDPHKAPTTLPSLYAKDANYWALGHIHKHYRDDEKNPRVVFPGCIQGRDIKEEGPRGCCIVTLEENKPNKVDFVPLSSIVWAQVQVDVTDTETLPEISERINRKIFQANGKALCEEMCFRVSLIGKTKLHKLLNNAAVLNDMRENINQSFTVFYCDALTNDTSELRPVSTEEGSNPFTSLLGQVFTRLHEDDLRSTEVLQDGFAEFKQLPPRVSADGMKSLNQAAQQYVADLLSEASHD